MARARALRILLIAMAAGLILGIALFFWLSAPRYSPLPGLENGNAARGERIAIASGCASCHGKDYAGGEAIHSPFGSFAPPNITPSAISDWSDQELAHAIIDGVAPDGRHYYPSFPYQSYAGIAPDDLADLIAYLRGLAPVARENARHDLALIARWRRPLGIWKRMNAKRGEAVGASGAKTEGAYLAEMLGHCQECHTPRNALGILKQGRAYEGGAVYGADGKVKSKVPSLMSGDSANWSEGELLTYLTEGFTPDYDSVGGEMVEVVENIARLGAEDQKAIAAYIYSLREH